MAPTTNTAMSTKERTRTGHKVTTMSSGTASTAAAPVSVMSPRAALKHEDYGALLKMCTKENTKAVEALIKAAESSSETRGALSKVAVDPLLELARNGGTWDVRELAVRAVMALADGDDDKALLLRKGVCGPLVAVLQAITASDEGKEFACWAVGALAIDADAKARLQTAGAIAAITLVLGEGHQGVQIQAAATLWKLAFNDDSQRVAIALSGAVDPLVGLRRRSGSKDLQQLTAGALHNLVAHARSRRVVADAIGLEETSTKFEVDRAIDVLGG